MSVWSRVGTLAPRAAGRVVSTADGSFAWALPESRFVAPPVVTASAEAATGRDHVVTLTAVTARTVSGLVRRSRTLPASILSLSALASFDPFEPAPGVTVALVAQAAT